MAHFELTNRIVKYLEKSESQTPREIYGAVAKEGEKVNLFRGMCSKLFWQGWLDRKPSEKYVRGRKGFEYSAKGISVGVER